MFIFEIYLVALCFYAAITDFLFYKIPNIIIALLLVGFIVKMVTELAMGVPLDHFIIPAISFAIVLVVGFILYALKIYGAGDVKLLAACSLWIAEINTLQFIVLTLIAGGGLAVIYILWHQGLDFLRNIVLAKIVNIKEGVSFPPTEKNAVPYAIAIFVGVVWVLTINGWGK